MTTARKDTLWIRIGASLLLLLLSSFGVSYLNSYSNEASVESLVRSLRSDLEAALKDSNGDNALPIQARVSFANDAQAYSSKILEHLELSDVIRHDNQGAHLAITMSLSGSRPSIDAHYGLDTATPIVVASSRPKVSGSSIMPAVIAILLAFGTGHVVFALSAAVVLGAILSVGYNPAEFIPFAAVKYFYEGSLSDSFNLWIIAFTCLLIGLVRLATRAGGMQGIIDGISKRIKDARSAQRATALMGVFIFFDDYANSMVVGTSMRPLSDRFRVAREKLAYIVDSTAAPIAGIALISTWIGFEIGLLSEAARAVGMEIEGYTLFLHAIPFRFYCFFALITVAVAVLSGRDFGPMLKAQRRASERGDLVHPDSRPMGGASNNDAEPWTAEDAPLLAHIAIIPILVVLLGTLTGIFVDGGGLGSSLSFASIMDAYGDAENTTFVMAVASAAGSLILFAMVLSRGLLSPSQSVRAYLQGIASVSPAIIILILAWALKAVCDDLGLNYLLVALLGDSISPLWVPISVFFLGAIIAFSTGTSWGTMGILIPIAVPLSFELGGAALTLITMAAVLDGAIFGDHCSPISDTTIMSSIASGCDHMDHVRTQIPYALTSMTTAAIFGYIWISFGLPWWIGMLLGASILVGVFMVFGRASQEAPP